MTGFVSRVVCLFKGHQLFNCDPSQYKGWAESEHEGEVPIGGCTRCGKQWWMDESKITD